MALKCVVRGQILPQTPSYKIYLPTCHLHSSILHLTLTCYKQLCSCLHTPQSLTRAFLMAAAGVTVHGTAPVRNPGVIRPCCAHLPPAPPQSARQQAPSILLPDTDLHLRCASTRHLNLGQHPLCRKYTDLPAFTTGPFSS